MESQLKTTVAVTKMGGTTQSDQGCSPQLEGEVLAVCTICFQVVHTQGFFPHA